MLLPAFLLALTAGAFASATVRRISRAPAHAPAPADAIVVFGAGVRDGRPSPELAARLDHAARLYREGWAPRVVCSGGEDEVRVMCRALAEQVDPEHVAADPGGVSTRATLRRARGLGRVLLVSSRFHAHRIGAEARRQRLDARVCPAPGCPLDAAGGARRRQVAREVVASWWYALGGRGGA